MKAIILAAGKGKRMGFKTNNKPKCLVRFNGKPIIDYILETLNVCGIDDIIIVNGYKSEVLETYLKGRNLRFITNKHFNTTNMVKTLFCAESEMDDDLIISYSDIIYKKEVLNKLINNHNECAVIVDKNWRELWNLRMENPLHDAETMKINSDGNITELGNKPKSYEDIEAQYIGLIKFSLSSLKKIIPFYHSLNNSNNYDGRDFNNMYMTSFIQLIIDNILSVRSEVINGGWLEFDRIEDLLIYEKTMINKF